VERTPWRNFENIYSPPFMSVVLMKLKAWLCMEKPLHPIKKLIIKILLNKLTFVAAILLHPVVSSNIPAIIPFIRSMSKEKNLFKKIIK
jgi:hypothetical protein